MAFCARCGGELPATARFCPTCGRPVEPEVGPPAPPRTRPLLAGWEPPAWIGADWPLVGLGVALMLALLFAGSAVFGLVAAAAVAGDVQAVPCGAAVGSHLAFAAFGARTFVGCGAEHGSALAIAFLPLPWALAGAAAVEAARRFAWRRLPDDRLRRLSYAAKLALAFGVALGIIAGLVARGDPARRGSGFASALNGGEVWFYSTVLTWFWAWLGLRRQGLRLFSVPPGAGPVRQFGRRAAEGAVTFVGLAVALAAVGALFALVVADGGHERVAILFGIPVVGFSFGAALADAAMGAALGGVAGHSSLLHFGLPAGPAAAAAPVWLFAAVLLAPGVVGAMVWRRLERAKPAEEQAALAIGVATGVGFAAAAWLAALLGRIVLLATVTFRGGWFGYAPQAPPTELPPFNTEGTIGSFLAARPNPATVLGLALLWGLTGGLGAAFLWAARHNARWQIAGAPIASAGDAPSSSPPAPAAAAPPPPAESAWLLPETPPTPVPPPEPAVGSPRPVGQGDGAEGGAALGLEPEPPGEKP